MFCRAPPVPFARPAARHRLEPDRQIVRTVVEVAGVKFNGIGQRRAVVDLSPLVVNHLGETDRRRATETLRTSSGAWS